MDGYRAIAVKDGARVRLISRNEKDLTHDYPQVVTALKSLVPTQAVLDGEIVALDGNGRSPFQALQHRSTADLAGGRRRSSRPHSGILTSRITTE
jgi:bifunctional non-homologous end joining protein LigD